MSTELSGQCEDELCLNKRNHIPIRVFPCLYHCKKMLCIQHLSDHDKYIEKQIQYQKELKYCWNYYISIFNENNIKRQIQELEIKLENYQQLNKEINDLLCMKQFQDSIENNQKLQTAIQTVEKAIREENPSKSINHIDPKIEIVMDNEEENQPAIDYSSLSSSITTNDESETVDSLPSLLNTNGNSPQVDQTHQDDECFQHIDDSDDQGNSNELENETDTMDDSSIKDNTKHENHVTPNRSIGPSRLRGYCPLTHDGVFGINSHVHGIRLCSIKSQEKQRTYRLNEHFRRIHHLTPLASLALARAVGSGQDPMHTRLFNDHHNILNIAELRTIHCPINRSFFNYPSLHIDQSPCNTIKQVRHLKDHLKRIHKFTNQAASIILKAVKSDSPVHMIQFPSWIHILEEENPF